MVEIREERGVFLAQGDDFLQMRLEFGEIRFLSGLHPGLLSQSGRLGKLDHVFRCDPCRFFVISSRHFDQSGLIRIRVEAGRVRLEFIDQSTQFRRGEVLVCQAFEGAQLIPTRFRPAGWHIGLLVPTKQSGSILEIHNLGDNGFELLQFLFHNFLLCNSMYGKCSPNYISQ